MPATLSLPTLCFACTLGMASAGALGWAARGLAEPPAAPPAPRPVPAAAAPVAPALPPAPAAPPQPLARVPAPPPALPCAAPPAPRADRPTWRHAIAQGSDAERAEALLQAQAAGAFLPPDIARGLLEADASERVRLAALDHWLAAQAGDRRAERAALEYALHLPGAALQQEARQRLDDLDQQQRLDAEGQRPR